MSGPATNRPLRVCLDARLREGQAGGVQQFVMGLAAGLSTLTDGDEIYHFLVIAGDDAWIHPHLSGPCRSIPLSPGPDPTRRKGAVEALARRFYRTRLALLRPVCIPRSDGVLERGAFDVMHFTIQSGFLTPIPSIYQPYDLQHLHYPEFFFPYERKQRDTMYRAMCYQACAVVVMSSWIKEDVVSRYGLPADKVHVIPWAPVVRSYPAPTAEDLSRARERLRLPPSFAFYPAQTWAHKNHLRLLDAVALLRDRDGLSIPVVCSGARNDFFDTIRGRLKKLRLEGQIHFPGYVSSLELRCLYQLARFVVFPSLFEGGGMPVFEAFSLDVPVACSNASGLPKQAGEAALLFDPEAVPAIASAMRRLWNDVGLRDELVRRGRVRVAPFTWHETARRYRALYRDVAGRPLTEEDRALLSEHPAT